MIAAIYQGEAHERVTVRTSATWWTTSGDAGRAWMIGKFAEYLRDGKTIQASCGARWCKGAASSIARKISSELSAQGVANTWRVDFSYVDGPHGSYLLKLIVFEVA